MMTIRLQSATVALSLDSLNNHSNHKINNRLVK